MAYALPTFTGYELRPDGADWQVISFRRNPEGDVLKGHRWADGRRFYNLTPDPDSPFRQAGRVGVNRQLAFWVLLALKGIPRPGEIACHIDDDPTNNDPSNLSWSAPVLNAMDRQCLQPRPHDERCRRGHGPELRYIRPNGRRSSCQACTKLSRFYPSGTIPLQAAQWPELLRPGNEELLLHWWALPLNHQLQMGGLECVSSSTLQSWLESHDDQHAFRSSVQGS